jgi:hypothetical protein
MWYRIFSHGFTFGAGALLTVIWERTDRYGFFDANECVLTATSSEVDLILTFEMMYCLLDACAHAASRESLQLDMIMHHALTMGLILGGEAHVHAALTMHFLAVCGPASLALLSKGLLDASRQSLMVLLDVFFAVSFVWARAILLPMSFVNQLRRCPRWDRVAFALHVSLLLLGLYWSCRVGLRVKKKIGCLVWGTRRRLEHSVEETSKIED